MSAYCGKTSCPIFRLDDSVLKTLSKTKRQFFLSVLFMVGRKKIRTNLGYSRLTDTDVINNLLFSYWVEINSVTLIQKRMDVDLRRDGYYVKRRNHRLEKKYQKNYYVFVFVSAIHRVEPDPN